MERLELCTAFVFGEEHEASGPCLSPCRRVGKSYFALSHGTPLHVDRVWMRFTPVLAAGWRVALIRSIWLLYHLPVLSSAGETDDVYEGESAGICAVALYDYQGGESAIQAVGTGSGSWPGAATGR